MIYGYARVSTKGQAKDGNSLEEQEKTLRERGASVICREAYTGAKGSRPELDRLLAVIQPRDTFMVTKMDRFARNTKDALAMVEDFRSRGIRIHILNMGLVDDTAMGRLMVTMLAAFAEYERAMIMERTQSGKAVAKERLGFKEGRPCACVDGEELAAALASGLSKTEAAKSLGISRSTLYRLTA